MRIKRFEDIDSWQFARELTRKVYGLDAPALSFEVSSSTCWLTSEVKERKATLNGELRTCERLRYERGCLC